MGKIQAKIPKQNFEIIRDRIAAILKDELDHQYAGLGNYDFADIAVTTEDNSSTDKTDCPIVNVALSKASWDNENLGSSDGTYVFDIDVVTNAKTEDARDGNYIASILMQRIAGGIRSILKNPVYKTLDFTTVPGFILRTTVSELNIRARHQNDALNSEMGRITFVVMANETTSYIEALMVEDYLTKVKVNNTQKGYQYYGVNY